MAIEIEKKYKLTKLQRARVVEKLSAVAEFAGEEFEVNTLYGGKGIDRRNSVLRLRRVGERAILTFKKRYPSRSSIKHQLEEEVEVSDAATCDALLRALGYFEALVYEKRRSTWQLGDAEIVVDELPFGWFMEVEASEEEIERTEKVLGLGKLKPEELTYPQLTEKFGKKKENVIAARFKNSASSASLR